MNSDQKLPWRVLREESRAFGNLRENWLNWLFLSDFSYVENMEVKLMVVDLGITCACTRIGI